MEREELDEWVAGYFRDWAALTSNDRAERTAARDGRLEDWLFLLLFFGPATDDLWDIVVALVERAPSPPALAFVSAGPLEDLVQRHGARFADRLIQRTRQDPRFREAMRGVWGWETVEEPLRGRLLELLGPGR